MSSNANLPAGFIITTLNGKRCTAVPRSLTTITGLSTTSTSTKTTARTTTPSTSSTAIESSTQTPESSSQAVPSPTAVAPAVPVITSSQTTIVNEPQDTQIPATSQLPATSQTPTTSQVAQLPPSSSAIAATNIASSPAEVTTPSPLPEVTTPTESSTASTSISTGPNALGLTIPSPLNNQNGLPLPLSTKTSSSLSPGPAINTSVPAQASISDTTSRSRVAPAPIVGGVMGSVAFIGFIALIFWFFRKRRRYQRDSLLTPLDGERDIFNEGDRQSISDEKPMSRFGTQVGYQTDRLKDFSSSIAAGIVGFGASLKSKVVRHPRDTASVDLNRGNSQFFDGPIPQHSRNNSVMSDRHSESTVKDRFNDWWERCIEIVGFNWTLRRNKRMSDPFATARGLSEKQSGSNTDFSQLLHINERDLQLQVDGQRGTASNGVRSSVPTLGDLGLNFESSNPFSDPLPPVASVAQKQPVNKDNPFVDPVALTQPTTKNKNSYIADVRRSRGQSANPTKNNQAALRSSSASRPYSRYASTIGFNRDSYRDTVFSANGRKGKGRSDPFDLERPELWLSSKANSTANANDSQNNARTSSRPNTRGSSTIFPDPLRMSSVQGDMAGEVSNHTRQPSMAHTRAISNDLSIYSSGVPSLAGWAGPGPDLGPGSSNTSLRGNASSDGDSHYRNDSAGGVYGQGAGIIKGSLSEMDLELAVQRDMNNVSPLSIDREWVNMRETGNTSPVSMVSKYSRKGVGEAL